MPVCIQYSEHYEVVHSVLGNHTRSSSTPILTSNYLEMRDV
jgi:hypothetical protein